MTESHLHCRVCGSEARLLGVYSPYRDFKVPVYGCEKCGSRLAPHDPEVHERMHKDSSTYDAHDILTRQCSELFDRGEERELRELLSEIEKFRFIIDTIDESAAPPARVLEVGCSSGGMASWFILRGYDYTGIDVSESAIGKARSLFGAERFYSLADWEPKAREPYDAIYHAGTIGCVDQPMGMTSDLLEALRPGGILVFNAPNCEACIRPGQLWVEGTHPPDLVTLFRPDIWEERFGNLAEVETKIEYTKGWDALEYFLKGKAKVPWEWKPRRHLFADERAGGKPGRNGSLKGMLRRAARRATATLFPRLLDGRWPSEFGVLVVMKKHQGALAPTPLPGGPRD